MRTQALLPPAISVEKQEIKNTQRILKRHQELKIPVDVQNAYEAATGGGKLQGPVDAVYDPAKQLGVDVLG